MTCEDVFDSAENRWPPVSACTCDECLLLRAAGSWAVAALDKLLTIVAVARDADPREPLPVKCAGCSQFFCCCGRGGTGEGW